MNEYSSEWLDTFLRTIDPSQSLREVQFLQRQLPRDQFPRVLDVCCGLGRHSGLLSASGYDVTGIDRDPTLIDQASRTYPRARFVAMDASRVATLERYFDAVICMWQSFGFGDRRENDQLLADVSRSLRAGGRFVLDIYNRRFFEPRQGVLTSNRNRRAIRETKSIRDDRISIKLIYDNDESNSDVFDWEIFTVEQIEARVEAQALKLLTACNGFDENVAISDSVPRMQLVFEKR